RDALREVDRLLKEGFTFVVDANRTCGSEGGEAKAFPTPIRASCLSLWIASSAVLPRDDAQGQPVFGAPGEGSGEPPQTRLPWQCLYFLPEPQGQAALRPMRPQVAGSLGSNSASGLREKTGWAAGRGAGAAPAMAGSGRLSAPTRAGS